MKPIISRLSEHSPLFFFPLLLLFRSWWRKYILFLFGVIILAGCYNKFYKTGTAQKVDATTIERLKSAQKYFIIHFRDEALSLTEVSMNEQFLSGKTGPLSNVHTKGLNPDQNGAGTFKETFRYPLLSEVHLYINKNKAEVAGFPDIKVASSEVYRMDIYEFDEKRTRSASTLSTIGIVGSTVAVIAAVAIIAGSSSSNPAPTVPANDRSCACPQVYVEQQGDLRFQNGIFSGAVFSNLERTDILPLGNTAPEKSTLRIRIAGHDNEVQYLNSAKLLAVYHQPGASILADRDGKFHAINNPEIPLLAIGTDMEDLKPLISKPDASTYGFTSTGEQDELSTILLSFNKPVNQQTAKLVIRAKNSKWSASLNQEYALLLGDEYIRYRNFMEKKSTPDMESVLLKQGLPIKVYVENGGKWDYAGYFPLTGTEGYRDMVMALNLPETPGATIRIKLESVYRFWDLDYAAIDYSGNEIVKTIQYEPISANHNLKNDQLTQLALTDGSYTELKNNESLDLLFKVQEMKGNNNVSYFLASGGYYHLRDAYPVKANISRLKEFKNAGEFNRFSREKYKELEDWQLRVNWLNHGSE